MAKGVLYDLLESVVVERRVLPGHHTPNVGSVGAGGHELQSPIPGRGGNLVEELGEARPVLVGRALVVSGMAGLESVDRSHDVTTGQPGPQLILGLRVAMHRRSSQSNAARR